MVNRLQKQLDDLRSPESIKRARLPSGGFINENLRRSPSVSSSMSDLPVSNQVVEMVKAEVSLY